MTNPERLSPMSNIIEIRPSASEQLADSHWAVQLGRSLVTNTSISFGAVVVYAAACAWRDRGPEYGDTDGDGDVIRNAAAIPPGGWPALVGCTPQTWRRWRRAAVSANLIEIISDGPGQLLSPIVKREDGEQWARVETAVLFHRELSQRARRVFVAVSLFRQSSGFASMSIRKIGADAGLERRAVQRGLRELATIGVLKPAGRGYMVIKSAPPPDDCDRPVLIKSGPPDDCDRPHLMIATAPPDDCDRPLPDDCDRPLPDDCDRPLKSLTQEPLSSKNFRSLVTQDSARQAARPDIDPGCPFDFELFRSFYPKRGGSQPWKKAVKAANARIKEGAQFSDMIEGARRYAEYCDKDGATGTKYVMQAATFLGPEEHYLAAWTPPFSKAESVNARNAKAAQEFLDSREECGGVLSSEPSPSHPQKELGLLTVIEGSKDARQESTPAPELTPDARRAKIAALEETLSHMKPRDPCFGMFTDDRAEHLAALDGDTERRASA